jgi:hypothetical protein
MAKGTITMDQLAKMTNEGFRTTAAEDEVAALHSDMKQKFEAVASRLDRIENLLLEGQTRKIENLEAWVKKLEDALAA